MERSIIRRLSILIILLLGFHAWPVWALQEGDVRYTAYNIWKLRGRNMAFINYKFKTSFIPAGSKVIIKEVVTGDIDYFDTDSGARTPSVTFTVADTGENHTLNFHQKYQRGAKFMDVVNRTFGSMDFDGLTEGFSEHEKSAIRRGVIVAGMSKEAVLVSYGYPPSHRTPSLSNNTWSYWASRTGRFVVAFDAAGKAVSNSHKVHSESFHAKIKGANARTEDVHSGEEIYKRMKVLEKMYREGLLSEEEYRVKKQQLVDKL